MCLAARIRLQRLGRKKRPFYRVVVIDSRNQRDGRAIEQLGYYNPMTDPAEINVNEERALYWLQVGAKPSDTAKSLFSKVGIWERFKNPVKITEEADSSETEAVEAEKIDETAEETSEE